MQKSCFFVFVAGFFFYNAVSLMARSPETGNAGSKPVELWNEHGSGAQHSSSGQYYRAPALKPSKNRMDSPLRRKGWHTQPDPYIEEGGAYTGSTHPSLTTNGDTMQQYGYPGQNYMHPPSNILRSSADHQQSVKIKDPSSGYVPPISLPPEQN